MEQQEIAEQWPHRSPSPDELRKLKTALRQVEWADTYLLAFANLELEDFAQGGEAHAAVPFHSHSHE